MFHIFLERIIVEIKDVLKIIGKNIKTYREKQNMTIKELSLKTKIRKEYLIKIENGKTVGMPYYYVMLIANVLKIKFYILCDGI